MAEKNRLVVLARQPQTRDRPVDLALARERAIRLVEQSGGKVRHDSGGRLLVVEAEEMEVSSLDSQPELTVLPLDGQMQERVPDLDPGEELFLRALTIRMSADYREQKRRRTVGDTPEEQLLTTAPCISPGA